MENIPLEGTSPGKINGHTITYMSPYIVLFSGFKNLLALNDV